jgi:ribosomal protein S18 acetylase RimI-like enzyme
MMKELTWDSEFFNVKIGEWNLDEGDSEGANPFELVYVKSSSKKAPILEGFKNSFGETKVVFTKQLIKKAIEEQNIHSASNSADLNSLYNLAYESGKFSRFKLDERFGIENFQKLYRAWVDNSINKRFADDVIVSIQNDIITGFVTYKATNNFATIGLIAVHPEYQGHGIGKKLLDFVEQQLLEKHILELRIPTQLENNGACSFYSKQGYTILETSYIMHYWKK